MLTESSSSLMRDHGIALAHEGRVEAERAADVLADAVQRVLAEPNGSAEMAEIVRVVVPTERILPLRWLRGQALTPQFYWRGRDDSNAAVACLGTADEFKGDTGEALERFWTGARKLLAESAPEARYVGGLAFGKSELLGEWAGFPSAWFSLPRFELVDSPFETSLICNLVLPRDRRDPRSLIGEIKRLRMPAADASLDIPSPLSRHDVPPRSDWFELVEKTLRLFSSPALGKLVLARKSVFDFAGPIDPYLLLERVEPATPGCFHFLVSHKGSGTFIGASPERLFRRRQRTIDSEAMAGTRPRGRSAVDDRRLREELLLSEKERLEHGYVERCIQENLEPLCESLHVDGQTSELALTRGRHLYSRIRGLLKEGITDENLLDVLHPTPAVGGYPTAAALEVLHAFEPFERGWYAAPIGWFGREDAEFAVGIRAGLVNGTTLSLYSGAGIVPGSRPAAEWDEIEHKIGDFTNVLGLDLQGSEY